MSRLDEVFGVSRKQLKSYVAREKVDGLFKDALKSDKQIIVYGSSKQGKTALVGKYVDYETNVVINLEPKMRLVDINKAILSKLGVRIESTREVSQGSKAELSTEMSAKVQVPLFLEGKGKVNGKISGEANNKIVYSSVEVNLELSDNIADLIIPLLGKKFVILENFHYLSDDTQRDLAYALRSYQELGVRFIILGVWRETNRLEQFNGDLVDRIREVPVEPWTRDEFMAVINIGCADLNIHISDDLVEEIIENAFDSIGVVQELLYALCKRSGIKNSAPIFKKIELDNMDLLREAIADKATQYSARHTRSLENIAQGRRFRGSGEERSTPRYLYYYTVQVFLTVDFTDIQSGIRKEQLEAEIKKTHHRPESVRSSDMTIILQGFTDLQVEKRISPPIFDFDRASRMLRVVDSTFYFFLKNIDRSKVLGEILNPAERANSLQDTETL